MGSYRFPAARYHTCIQVKTKSYVFLLGYVENPEDEKFEAPKVSLTKNRANAMMARYQTDADVEKAFAELNDILGEPLIQIRSRILQ